MLCYDVVWLTTANVAERRLTSEGDRFSGGLHPYPLQLPVLQLVQTEQEKCYELQKYEKDDLKYM